LHTILPNFIKGVKEVWVLRGVSFEIEQGESIAILGRNGSGKSTLLQILAGTLSATGGEASINGRVSALLELGSGFNPEYSGRENVLLNGLLLGLSKEEILSRFDEIENFAEIGDAINFPVKTYSSGMVMRLAFAVQVICDPQVLIIDEALSVGDFYFQQKCISYIKRLRKKGVTLLIVSHDAKIVRDLCTKGICLDDGRLAYVGDCISAIQYNLGLYLNPTTKVLSPKAHYNRTSVTFSAIDVNQSTRITKVEILDDAGFPSLSVALGSSLIFKVSYCMEHYEEPVHISMLVFNRSSELIYSGGTYTHNFKISPGNAALKFILSFPIEAGEYSVKFNIGTINLNGHGSIFYETLPLGPISVNFDYGKKRAPFYGCFSMPLLIEKP